MTKTLYILMLTIISNYCYAQTNYSKGFSTGYKAGYCYGKGVGCVSPIPPISPLPKIGESSSSYMDGYNMGIILGQNKSNEQAISKQVDNGVNIYAQPTVVPELPLFKPNLDFYQQMLNQAVNNYKATQKLTDNESNEEIRAILKEQNDPIRIERDKGFINFVKTFYSELKTYPRSIPNGTHKAISVIEPNTNQEVEEVEVVVKNNKIIALKDYNSSSKRYHYAYDTEEFPDIKQESIYRAIQDPSLVNNGVAKIRIDIYGKNTLIHRSDVMRVLYFVDYLSAYQQAQIKIESLKNQYNLKKNFSKVEDGWNLCWAHDGEGFCGTRKVFVENGKIKLYKTGDGIDQIITSGGAIVNGKSNISYLWKSENGKLTENMVFELLFL